MLPTLSTLLSLCLIAACVFFVRVAIRRRQERDEARTDANDIARDLYQLRLKMHEISGLDNAEFLENMTIEYKTETVSSDEWQVEVPYGKWGEFPSEDGTPSPQIRAFWPGVPAKIFGVKMPVGSHYVMHSHHWCETLTCLTGEIRVEVEDYDKQVVRTLLLPGDSITIPGGKRHAVAFATVASQFVCIWTRAAKPKKD